MAAHNIRTLAPGRRSAYARLGGFALAWAVALVCVGAVVVRHPTGVDTLVYWQAWHAPLYAHGFVYPPTGALLFAPAALLPWEVFAPLWYATLAAAALWLLWPLPLRLRVPLFIAVAATVPWGNAATLLAIPLVLAPRWPAAWILLAFTKMSPALGAITLVRQRRWREAALLALAAVAVAAATYAVAPDLVRAWLDHLRANTGIPVWLTGLLPFDVPLFVRIPIAVAIAWFGSRRPWTLALAAAIATPDLQLATCGLLAALPRLALEPDRTRVAPAPRIELAPAG